MDLSIPILEYADYLLKSKFRLVKYNFNCTVKFLLIANPIELNLYIPTPTNYFDRIFYNI